MTNHPAASADDRTAQFEELRPLLFSIAYRILGSVSEAEDAVQDSWLRWATTATVPVSPKAFLCSVVTRVSIDVLRSARVRREAYVGPWFPEPLVDTEGSGVVSGSGGVYDDPERSAELADSLSTAALLLLETLTPLERAVFVLREVFGFDYPEIAASVGRSEAACRQLAARARAHVDAGRPRFEADRAAADALAERFFAALRDGEVDDLREMLAADVRLVGDSGGKAPHWGGGVFGAANVARVLEALVPAFLHHVGRFEPCLVNGQPGAVVRDTDGLVFSTMTAEVVDGRVQTIRSVLNPDKLRHLGPVGDAWAVVNATQDAARRGE